MKKLIALFAVVGMTFAVSSCDFGEDEDVYEETDGTVEPDEGNVDPDGTVSGPCQAGESDGLKFVRIEDSLDNPSLAADHSNCTSGNPGADIDAVGIYRDDNPVAWAGDYTFEPWADATCDNNDKADPAEVLGAEDGVAGDGQFSGYFSMNGGVLVVSFENSEELLCGDILYIVEMYNPDSPTATIENYTVYVGREEAGPWFETGTDVTGTIELDIEWDW